MKYKRIIWIIIDSVGIGYLPDAADFGDVGADTLGHIFDKIPNLNIPNMIKLGLTNIDETSIEKKCENPMGVYFKAMEVSKGKDTTIGHWEMIGIPSYQPFPTYLEGFPDSIIDEFIKKTGVPGILANCAASGTEIIKQFGKEHIESKKPIIYTSADSVFQIACHEDVYTNEELYEMCKVAREILTGENAVARVIARPFKGDYPFERTAARRDYSIVPPTDNLLVRLKDAGYPVIAVGKIEDIFSGSGITEAVHTKDNQDGMNITIDYLNTLNKGLIFTNLVEFDSKWGHRRDLEGYAKGLEEFDARLGELLSEIKDDDLVIINADHGCDPGFKGTDHTREYIPVLVYSRKLNAGKNLHIRKSFSDIGATIAENFEVSKLKIGESFYNEI